MTVEIKAIGQLANYTFIVPSFQRGYRWTKLEIERLLNDIWEFLTKHPKEQGEFYCLQPIVVKKVKGKEKTYYLIDGQQRLTTIYLISKALKKLFSLELNLYNIEYETRQRSRDFLENIEEKTEKDAKENPDFFYMWKAYKVIERWLEERKQKQVPEHMDEETFKDLFKEGLVKYRFENDKDITNNIRIIWYELDENEDEKEKFIRLNSGKIPLTDSELIRGFLLLRRHFKGNEDLQEKRQIEVAKEWDDINTELKNDNFWYFVSSKDYDTRMDLIFEVLLNIKKDDKYTIFFKFKEKFQEKLEKGNAEKVWEDIKRIYHYIKFWYEDNEFYHFIGLLVQFGKHIREIFEEIAEKTKNQARKLIKNKVKEELKLSLNKESIKVDNKLLRELEYDKDKKLIEKLLLLYNILIVIEANKNGFYYRFPFSLYKKSKWSLEHIHAVNSKNIEPKDREIWIDNNLKILRKIYNGSEGEELRNIENKFENFKNEKDRNKKDELFENIKSDIIKLFEKEEEHILKEEEKNSLLNLSLLTVKQNSYLNNNTFAVKRKFIIDMDKKGEFIPIATKNVFLKYYSEDIKDPYLWTKKDAEAYLKDIEDKLINFLKEISNE